MSVPLYDLEANPFDACPDALALCGELTDYASGLGSPFFSYLLVRPPRGARASVDPPLITNYPLEWQDRYLERQYALYDPVALLTRQARLPFFWGSDRFLRPFRKAQRRVFYEGREHAIVHGYSIPVCGPDGDIGVFSIVGSDDGDLTDCVHRGSATLLLTAVQAHDRFIKMQTDADAPADVLELSAREMECLRWTADGKTSDEIAVILSLAPATVNFHLNKAIRKMDACNRHHAAIKAIRRNLI